MKNKVEGTSPNYQTILNYLQRNTRLSYFGEIVIPPVLMTSEVLNLSLEETEEIYQEMLERAIIRQQSDYEYTIAGYFPLTDELKQKLGTISSRR